MSFENELFSVLTAQGGFRYLQRTYDVRLDVARHRYTLTVVHDFGGEYEVHADTKRELLRKTRLALNLATCLQFPAAERKVVIT